MAGHGSFEHGFPSEIILQILLFLPAESLLRMMLVCKEWHTLITQSFFKLQYFELSSLCCKDSIFCGPKLFSSRDDHYLKFISNINPCEILLDKDIPISFDSSSYLMVNSCNGLVCFTNAIDFGTHIYILNPFIRKYRVTSTSTLGDFYSTHRKFDFFFLGLGFHTPTNDHKIVRIACEQFERVMHGENVTGVSYIVEVYSLSTNSWKRIEVDSFPWAMKDSLSRTSIHDRVHWMVYKSLVAMILSFDFVSEKFEEFSLPDECYEIEVDTYFSHTLFLIKRSSSLAFVMVYCNHNEGGLFCTIWVMEEYGVVESWRKMFHAQVFSEIKHRMITSIRTSGIVFQDSSGEMCCWNFDIDEMNNDMDYMAVNESKDFLVVRESLFMLDDTTENGQVFIINN